jgi:Flp pilus assembly protein TadD
MTHSCHPDREGGTWSGGGAQAVPPARPGPSLTLGMTIVLLLAAVTAGAQARGRPPRIPPPGRQFLPPRSVTTAPIHPRAHRTEGPIPFPPAEREWLRLDTPHFILYTSGSERGARAMADDFERLTALLLRVSPFFRRPAARTRVFLFNERRDVQPYLNATRNGDPVDAIGVTVRHAGGSTMLVDAGARGGDIATPRHELVHDLLRHVERPLPLWVEEGVAEYYSNAGLPIHEHASRLRAPRIPLREMFAMTIADPRALTADFYAQSWGVVATLKRLDLRAFFELLRDLERGADAAATIDRHYGKSLQQLAIEMRRASFPTVPLHMHEKSVDAEVRKVGRAEVLYQLATMLSHMNGGEDEADRHFRAALAAGSNDAEAHLRYAEFLFTRDRLPEARVVAEQTLAFSPDDPRLYAIIGVDARDVATLECARERLPQRLDLDFHLYAAYMQHGERAKADVLFPLLAESPLVNEVRRILLRADIARADALARDGNLTEAVRVLRELAEKMPGKTRSQLEEQAARLEKLH